MFHRLPRQALRLQRCQNGRIDYGYIQGKKVSGVSFGEKKKEEGGIKVCCLEKSWHCRDIWFWTIRRCYILYIVV